MAITWRDSYNLGDSAIDAQHRKLFVLVNTLLAATEEFGSAEAVANLFQHTRDHFAHEETLMRKTAYPGLQAHVEQHKNLLAKLGNASELITNYNLNMGSLESFLEAWLFNHLETLDAPLVNHIQRQ